MRPRFHRSGIHDSAGRALLLGLALAVTLTGCTPPGRASGSAAVPTVGLDGSPAAAQTSPSEAGSRSSATVIPGHIVSPTADRSPSPFLDIVGLRARAAGDQLMLDLALAGDVPTGSPSVGVVAYWFNLDTDRDDRADYRVGLQWEPGGGFVPVFESMAPRRRLVGPAFPGTATFAGSRIAVAVTLDALGCPSTVGVRGRAEQTRTGETLGTDEPGPAEQPTIVATHCPAP
jgi:hypothetical protein